MDYLFAPGGAVERELEKVSAAGRVAEACPACGRMAEYVERFSCGRYMSSHGTREKEINGLGSNGVLTASLSQRRGGAENGMRNMSFFHTQKQIRDRSKSVTRRIGWADLQHGEHVCAIVKGQGLKKGEKIERLAEIECVSVTPERLDAIVKDDRFDNDGTFIGNAECEREGFPEMTGAEFVAMFCRHMIVRPERIVNRVEFKYV